MKFFITVFCLLYTSAIQAHHTKDHMMILEDSAQVIVATQQGGGGMFWLLWAGTIILLVLGFVRWWNSRP